MTTSGFDDIQVACKIPGHMLGKKMGSHCIGMQEIRSDTIQVSAHFSYYSIVLILVYINFLWPLGAFILAGITRSLPDTHVVTIRKKLGSIFK